MLLENISLFWNLETTLQENMGYLIHLFFFFQVGIGVPIVLYILDTCPIFLNSFFSFSFFMNNFCIAHASSLQQNFGALIWWMEKPIKHIFGVHSQCRGKTFFGGSGWKTCFCAYPQCRSSAYLCGVYVILILRAWQTSHKGQQRLTKLNAK